MLYSRILLFIHTFNFQVILHAAPEWLCHRLIVVKISMAFYCLKKSLFLGDLQAQKIPWMEETGRLQSMGSRRVGHDWATSLSLFTFMHWRRKWQPTPVFLLGESHSSVLAMESHRVGHDWSGLAAAAAAGPACFSSLITLSPSLSLQLQLLQPPHHTAHMKRPLASGPLLCFCLGSSCFGCSHSWLCPILPTGLWGPWGQSQSMVPSICPVPTKPLDHGK